MRAKLQKAVDEAQASLDIAKNAMRKYITNPEFFVFDDRKTAKFEIEKHFTK